MIDFGQLTDAELAFLTYAIEDKHGSIQQSQSENIFGKYWNDVYHVDFMEAADKLLDICHEEYQKRHISSNSFCGVSPDIGNEMLRKDSK